MRRAASDNTPRPISHAFFTETYYLPFSRPHKETVACSEGLGKLVYPPDQTRDVHLSIRPCLPTLELSCR